jgi:indolepyruvate ferredoxin oxidoreductase
MKRKLKLGTWFDGAFKMLYALRGLRGGALDIFGRAEVRRVERALIDEYRGLIEKALAGLSFESYDRAVKLAALPDTIRGYEEIKLRNVAKFREHVKALGF